MMGAGRRLGLVLVAVVGVSTTFGAARPMLVWNTTASAPEGLYRVLPATPLRVGDWVAARPPAPLATWLAARRYLPYGAFLIKQVAALPPQRVCRFGEAITVDGTLRGRASSRDTRGLTLPRWEGCRTLSASDVFLLNRVPGSLDGRYFGLTPIGAVVGRVAPVWLMEGPRHGA